ncbi:MAG: deoxyribonuclease IV [Lentisphaerae bacterium]|jgi:deoxyribonuclease-4|nr:deoxyribonuclease IV [Lentisphaerota bacterium]
MKIGCHLSSAGGYLAMAQTAVSIGANVFQFFTRNPRGGAAKPIDKADVKAFAEFASENGIGPILAHAPYTLNAASSDPRIRDFAMSVFVDDLNRLEHTPGALYNFHPGSHVGQGAETGIALISDLLLKVFDSVEKRKGGAVATTVLLETMSGKGSEVGRNFEEVRAVIDRVGRDDVGVCLDTCHVWDGGYDIVNDLDGVLDRFDSVIGLGRLKAIHLNDSMNVLAAHKDRHEKIGKGKIGLDALARVINHPKLRNLPFYLETPCDLQGYKEEIALLKGLWK